MGMIWYLRGWNVKKLCWRPQHNQYIHCTRCTFVQNLYYCRNSSIWALNLTHLMDPRLGAITTLLMWMALCNKDLPSFSIGWVTIPFIGNQAQGALLHITVYTHWGQPLCYRISTRPSLGLLQSKRRRLELSCVPAEEIKRKTYTSWLRLKSRAGVRHPHRDNMTWSILKWKHGGRNKTPKQGKIVNHYCVGS